ncbi:MAG: hypothetical protein Q7T07_02585 [Burkholderiaceae bacterium]|nr:hypothetical protein [Burkholderiaceae bacterium]
MKYPSPALSATLLLLLVHTSGFSMSLGQSTGSVVFGRPIDLTVQARLDEPMEEPANCFSADIFQGDTRFDSNRVRVEVKAATNPLEALIRIRTTAPVSEPWAKVILRSNCGSKMSRQYDFLTDFVSDIPASIPNSRLAMVAPARVGVQDSAIMLAPLSSTKTTPAKQAVETQKLAKATPKDTKRAVATTGAPADNGVSMASNLQPLRPEKLKSTAKLSTKTESVADGKSRLKMETFDLMDEQQVMLKLSTALLSPVSSDTPANKQALAQAAAVWRTLNAKPEDLAADAQKLQSTTAELQSVKESALKIRTSLQERLHVAEEKQFANPLVYGLLGLLALTLAGLAWLFVQVRKGNQPGYAWLREQSASAFVDPQMEEPLIEERYTSALETTALSTTTQTDEPPRDDTDTLLSEEEVSALPVTLGAHMVFTKPTHKPALSVDNNNPLWPANAASSTQTASPVALVITPTEAFMRPITAENAAEHVQADMEQQIRGHADPVVLSRPTPKGSTAPAETLNIDLDFFNISPAKPDASPSEAHSVISEGSTSHGKTKKARHNGSLPKSVHQLHTSTVPPLVTDLKSNLIDFESFANPIEAPHTSRFTS